MQGSAHGDVGRRLIIGRDSQGRSYVDEDVSQARAVRPNGAVVQEIWRQERLPARAEDDGIRQGEMAAMPPLSGASIRLFTLPPHWQPGTLHRTASLHVITVVSGQAYLVLDTTEVLLRQGDSLVLPGSMHTWRNPFPEAALMVSAVFHLAE
jgi:quercetin dioxygenase-like cupin family protein